MWLFSQLVRRKGNKKNLQHCGYAAVVFLGDRDAFLGSASDIGESQAADLLAYLLDVQRIDNIASVSPRKAGLLAERLDILHRSTYLNFLGYGVLKVMHLYVILVGLDVSNTGGSRYELELMAAVVELETGIVADRLGIECVEVAVKKG